MKAEFPDADERIRQLVEDYEEERILMKQAHERGECEIARQHHQSALRYIGEAWRLTKEKRCQK